MKTKLLLPAFLALFATTAFSQSYEPFINFDKYWDIYLHNNGTDEPGYRYYIEDSSFVVDGMAGYRIIGHLPPSGLPREYGGWIAEDTSLKKVYLYYGPQEGWKPVYDFSLEVGDSAELHTSTFSGVFYVTQIDTVIHPNQTKSPRWYVTGVSIGVSYTYTQDFGNIERAFFNPIGAMLSGTWYNTICYGIYGDSALEANCTGETLNHIEQELLQITLYPNPASHIITLNLENANTLSSQELQLEIYNMQGQRCMSETLSAGANAHPVNIEGLPAGLYFLELKNKGGKSIWREKLMVK